MLQREQKILVVDDLQDWRQTLGGLLKDAGYRVEVADSTGTAMETIASNGFDLALIDIRLDESDEDNVEGLELAEKIRERWPEMKIIIITGYGTPERMKRAMEPDARGQRLASEYIPKTQTEELVSTVEGVLSR